MQLKLENHRLCEINYLCGSFNRQDRDVELTEDVSEEGVAGEVQQPLILCVIPGHKNLLNVKAAKAPQLDQVCELNRSCL